MKGSKCKAFPFMSVILPTYKREKLLCKTIQNLLLQDYPIFEIIVVDQTTIHEPQTLQFLNNVSNQIRYYKIQIPNIPAARNFGIEKANGEILLCMDDDMEFDRDLLKNHAKNYNSPDVSAVAGRVLWSKCPNGHNFVPKGNFNFFGKPNWDFYSTISAFVQFGPGPNFSFRRSVLQKVGGYDSNLPLTEDADFTYRVWKAGFKIFYDPSACTFHLEESTGGCQLRSNEVMKVKRKLYHDETLFYLKNFETIRIPFCLIYIFVKYVLSRRGVPSGMRNAIFNVVDFLIGAISGFKTYLRFY